LVSKAVDQSFYDKLRDPGQLKPESSLSIAVRRAMRAETERSIVLCAIGLKRYAIKHGGNPPTLEVLVPEFLASVPVDYMDGKPMKYHRNEDGTFVLYSVGDDLKDGNGKTDLLSDKTSSRNLWDRKDFVWPGPATAEEVAAYQLEESRGR